MSYNSDIDLRLGETPKTDDPKLFADMIDVYNAIHILSQYLNTSMKNQGSGDENTPSWDAMPFRDYFYTEAARSITKGSVITVIEYAQFSNERYGANPYTIKGAMNGAAGFGMNYKKYSGTKWASPNFTGITGIALNDAEPGQLVKMGIGPAIIKMEGVELGEPIFAYAAWNYYPGVNTWSRPYASEVNDGSMFRIPKDGGVYAFKSNPVVVGKGVAKDAVMFCPPETWGGAITYGAPSTNEPGGGGDN